jgi:hypothetical protein
MSTSSLTLNNRITQIASRISGIPTGTILNKNNTFTGSNNFIQVPKTQGTATLPKDIPNLETVQALIGGGGAIPSLNEVLTTGNDANNNDINNVNNLTVSTILNKGNQPLVLGSPYTIIDYSLLNLNGRTNNSTLQLNGVNGVPGQVITVSDTGRPYWKTPSGGQPQNIEQVLTTGNDAGNKDILNIGNLQNNGYYKDSLGSIGSFGQILSSNGVSTQWINPATPEYATLDGVNVFTGYNTFTQPLIIDSLSITTASYPTNQLLLTNHSLPLKTLAGNFVIPLFISGGKAPKMSAGIPSSGTQKVILGNINNWTQSNYFNQALTVDSLIINNQSSIFGSTSITFTNKCIRIIIDDNVRFIQLFTVNDLNVGPLTPLDIPKIEGTNQGLATIGGDNVFDGTNTMKRLYASSLIFTKPSVYTPNLTTNFDLLNIEVGGQSYYIQLFQVPK